MDACVNVGFFYSEHDLRVRNQNSHTLTPSVKNHTVPEDIITKRLEAAKPEVHVQ